MASYLLTWNPHKWNWSYLDESVRRVGQGKNVKDTWTAKNHSICPGDQLFLLRQGQEPRGIMASAYALSHVRAGPHYDQTLAAQGKQRSYVDLLWDALVPPEPLSVLSLHKLRQNSSLAIVNWRTQCSGIRIPDDAVPTLEKLWSDHLERIGLAGPERSRSALAEEWDRPGEVVEGAVTQVAVNVYERSPEGRQRCLDHWGYKCAVCDFDFAERYGTLGEGFIHVHHTRQLADIGRQYTLDPVGDLRPVCPNCHAMIHRRRVALTIDQLKAILRRNSA